MNEGSARQQIVEAIKGNSNILVTVSDSPSVDELSAALGLTILLNKMDKRATAIFSGKIPPALTFLEPEKTLEGSVDSLRDFIIALDKEKADHLRYKVDGDLVKIFITPYRTTLSEQDLQFSQGDYNVELVIALGVKDQDHLDKALSAHGKILHDAMVVTVTAGTETSTLGSVDWHDASTSSLSEMLVSLVEPFKGETPLLDEQIATALLTGIVAATDRFSNDRTSSRVMTMAAQLMAAGANQQLIAAKLQEAHEINPQGPMEVTQDTVPKSSKAGKKSKKDSSELAIDRSKKAKQPVTEDDAKPAAESSVPPAETTVAGMKTIQPLNDDIKPDDKPVNPIGDQAAAVTPDMQAVEAQSLESDLEAQLAEQLKQPAAADPTPQESTSQEAPVVPEPSVPMAPVPDLTASTPSVQPVADTGMPGFEALDAPMPPPAPVLSEISEPVPEPELSPFIETHPGDAYLQAPTPASFDSPVSGVESTVAPENGVVPDPFSMPLPPLPQPAEDSAQVVPPDGAGDQTLPLPPSPSAEPVTGDVPPLPPMPDFNTLPPLPTPPPPPVFDQPAAGSVPLPTQAGPISADKLGDIFGDSAAQSPTPSTPDAPTAPPAPGQFKIPGQ